MFKFLPIDNSRPVDHHTPFAIADYQYWIQRGACPELSRNLCLFDIRMQQRGHKIAVTQLHRTISQQAAMYAQGRSTPGTIITDARPESSAHCATDNGRPASQAFDIAIRDGSKVLWDMNDQTQRFWSDTRDTGNMLSLTWGATFNNPPRDFGHFQLSTFKGN